MRAQSSGRKPTFLLRAAVLFLASASALAAGRPGSSAQPEDWLPDDTLVFLKVDDPSEIVRALAQHPFMALLSEPEVMALVTELAKRVPSPAKPEKIDSASTAALVSLLSGPISLAITPPPREGAAPDFVFTAGARDPQQLSILIDSLTEKIRSDHPEATVGKVDLRGREGTVLSVGGLSIFRTVADSRLLLSTRRERIEATLAAIDAPDSHRALSRSADFTATMAGLGRNEELRPGISAYVDVRSPLAARMDADPSFKRLVCSLGFDTASSLGWSLELTKEGFRERTLIRSAQGFHGLAGSLASARRDRSVLFDAPAGCLIAAGAKVDPASLWDETLAGLKRASPLAADAFVENVARFEKGFGQTVRGDLLRAFSGQLLATFEIIPDIAATFDVSFSLGIADRAAVDRAAARFAQTVRGVRFRAVPYEGETIYVRSDEDAAFAMVSPAFCVTQNALVVALSTDSLKRVLAKRKNAGPSLRESAEWRALESPLGETGSAGAVGLLYFDGRQAFSTLYNAIVPLVQSFSGVLKLPVDPALIPSCEAIGRHISASACALTCPDGSLVLTSVSPLPSPCGPLLLAIGAGLVMSESASGPERATTAATVSGPEGSTNRVGARAEAAIQRDETTKRLTLNYSNTPVADVLQDIASRSGIQFSAGQSVLEGRAVTVRLEGVEPSEAIEIVCDAAGLKSHEKKLRDGRTVYIISLN